MNWFHDVSEMARAQSRAQSLESGRHVVKLCVCVECWFGVRLRSTDTCMLYALGNLCVSRVFGR